MDFLTFSQNVFGVGLVAWLAKSLTKYWIDKGVERYKGSLALESQKYKADLERITNEHSVMFSNLHTKRADIIEKLYLRLFNLTEIIEDVLRKLRRVDEKPLPEKMKIFAQRFNGFRSYYKIHKIYFDQELCLSIDKFINDIVDIFYDINTYPLEIDSLDYRYDQSLLKERYETWQNARNMFKGSTSKIKESLEVRFREILGVCKIAS